MHYAVKAQAVICSQVRQKLTDGGWNPNRATKKVATLKAPYL
jgi:hypothetical protein